MHGSVTIYIEELRDGNPEAASELWARYFKRVAGLAKKHLRKGNIRAADEEDVAVIVFHRLWDKFQAGEDSWVTDRTSLWVLLARMTAGNTIDLLRHERRKIRGGGRVRGESAFVKPGQAESGYEGIDQAVPTTGGLASTPQAGSEFEFVDQIMGKEVTPEFVILMRDQCRLLLDRLNEDERKIAILKLEGCTAPEIHERLPRLSVNMIEKRLALIRRKWLREWEAMTPPPKPDDSAGPASDSGE